ncbi:MAG: hypothetical protein K2Y21_00950 [Phycisphaerales bacterium]|nr:hypothetical protein [Phycisphaerales bacterium]
MRFSNLISRSALFAAGVGSLAFVTAFSGGCAREYANYPPIEGDTFAVKDLNSRQMQDAMAAALRWTVLRYPPAGGSQGGEMLAINLPPGIGEAGYAHVAERVGEGAVPVTEDNAKRLPVYHVTRIWLRGTVARIDVVRPLYEMGEKPGGGPVNRGVQVRLAGGWEPWRVTSSSEYEVGVLDAPALNPIGSAIPAPAARAQDPAPHAAGESIDPTAGEDPKKRNEP